MGKKRDQRLLRQLAKHEKFEQKKVRQAIEPAAEKSIVEGVEPDVSKVVKEAPARAAELVMEYNRDEADVVGDWTWGARSCLDDQWVPKLLPFLTEYAKKTWMEIYNERTTVGGARVQKHLSYSVTSICKEAQDRLVELQFDDVDKIFRFRLTDASRLYGIQRSHVFFVLWWDPQHNIFPTTLN